MTVSYQYEVASSTSGGFTRLLLMWRGSLYKLIYRELFLFLSTFGFLSLLYRNAFTADQSRLFEQVVVYCDTFISLIPLSFVLGFYVAYVAGRWWQQYMAIPWPDKSMHCIALYVNGNDTHARMVRRTLMRYLNLSLILVLRSISSAVKRRFPTLDHVVESGFMTSVELEMYQSVPSAEFNTYWIPCTWFISLLKESKKNARITDSNGLKIIMEEFNEFRSKCGLLWSYDWVSIPLVYTQVVTIATYSFFLAALIGRQYVDTARKPFQMEIDKFLPIFTILQFFFFMGLLKVAEQLINPFGDDDEDFELNWLIDRHTKVSYLGVDTLMMRSPPLVKDMYFNESDLTLPYTEAAVAYKKKTYRGSVHNMEVPEEKHTMFLPEILEEDDDKPMTPKSSSQNLQQLPAAAAGSGRGRRPSCTSLVMDFSGPKVEKDVPAPSLWKSTLVRSDSTQSRRLGASSSVRGWPSASTLAPSDTSLKNFDTETINAPLYDIRCLEKRKDSDVSSVGGLKFSVGPGIVSFNSQTSLLRLNRENAQESPILTPRENKNKYLSSSRENINQSKQTIWPKSGISFPKVINMHKPPSSSGNKKKGVRWKTVLDDNLDKRKTVDVVEALSQILNADEDYIHEQDEIAKNSENNKAETFLREEIALMKGPIYCSNCKMKMTKLPPAEEKQAMNLASGKLTANLKKLLIYRPIDYMFITRSCPNLTLIVDRPDTTRRVGQADIALQSLQDNFEGVKCEVRRIDQQGSRISLGKSKSMPNMKINFSKNIYNPNNLTQYDSSVEIPRNVTTAIIEEDASELSDHLGPIETLCETVPACEEPDLIPTSVNDISWQSADWSTLLSRSPSLDLNVDSVGSYPCDETLLEVVVNLGKGDQT